MPTIKIDRFSGIMPRVHPTLLPDGCAVKAHNCRLQSGKLSPILQPVKATEFRIRMEDGLSKISDANSIFLWKRGTVTEMLAWPGVVKVAPSNIADDTLYRLFVSGATGVGGTGKDHPCAYIASPSGTSYTRHSLVKTALPAPIVTTSSPSDPDNIRYTYFFQTWVDAYGYESGVSLPSPEIEYNEGQSVNLSVVVAPAGASKRRVYKVVTGSETERIQFVYEQNAINSYFPQAAFNVKDEDAGEVIQSIVSPPEDLTWMSYVPGNFYVGVSAANKRTVMFSDVDRPTSWPDAYMYDIKDDFVGLAVCGNTVFVMTTGFPWAISGTAPESMSPAVMATAQGCVSDRSICVMDGVAFYASQDGICMLSSESLTAPVITEKYFSKREWEALNPSTCIMEAYDGALHAWFTLADGTRQGYIIDIGEGVSAITTHDEQAKAVCYDPATDGLYYVREV